MSVANNPFGFAGWWDRGHELLHVINPVRLAYVCERLGGLAGRDVVDVGCGGGILSEAMAREGARVTGVDVSEEAIAVAREHAKEGGLDITYDVAGFEDLSSVCARQVDAVTCMEVLEHVEDPSAAIGSMARALRPQGSLFLSTINRTALSGALMIYGLECALGAIPQGTHRHELFRKPSEVGRWCEKAGLKVSDVAGANWSFFGKTFLLSRTFMPVNYLMHATKG